MKYEIRPYSHSDFETVSSWWNPSPKRGLLVENGSFILELDKVPALCLTVLLTQSKEMSYIFAFIKNPEFKQSLEDYGFLLWDHCFQYAKDSGYNQIICFADNEKLIQKYQRFGMTRNLSNLTSFLREL